MLFKYQAIDPNGERKEGSIDAVTKDVAINSLQHRGLIISKIIEADKGNIFDRDLTFFERVSNKETVILSRQIATLFEAQVSALKVFRLVATQIENKLLVRTLNEVAEDIQGGSSISKALVKHPKVFSSFYVNMVKAGEESGRLDKVFMYLADYLDRNYEVVAKVRGALVYPAFVILVFISVMLFMFTSVIPSITQILKDGDQEIPVYTKIVIGISDFLVQYGLILLLAFVVFVIFLIRYVRTDEGKIALSKIKINIPILGDLYRKLYLSRLSDNMSTMLASGIPMVKVIETTRDLIDNKVFTDILDDAVQRIRSGSSVSDAFARHEDIPQLLVQMISVGEETGELGNILETLAKFYRREVQNAVDTMIGLIEPAMIVLLGGGVLILLVSVLVPIYNITNAI